MTQSNAFTQTQWPLRVASMIKQEFLVSTHLAWEPAQTNSNNNNNNNSNKLINCLVTWEVYGGGLMGNLLTDSSTNVELSLWPDTKYRVQVTCKNKVSIIILNYLFVIVYSFLLHNTPLHTHTPRYIFISSFYSSCLRTDPTFYSPFLFFVPSNKISFVCHFFCLAVHVLFYVL